MIYHNLHYSSHTKLPAFCSYQYNYTYANYQTLTDKGCDPTHILSREGVHFIIRRVKRLTEHYELPMPPDN